ncbi:hypothetical protein ACGFRB_08980 [Streptomyces sp. NPDC048718]|uniref:hypothetical protein n=1 Tax=Streptomyces sp. NPDC048718 TaxID=3365587 RepID=UPI00371DE78C
MTGRIELATDHGLRRHPEPSPGCTVCALLVDWFAHYTRTGPERDESAAVDCAVEIRNHPHAPPKMTLNRRSPPHGERRTIERRSG